MSQTRVQLSQSDVRVEPKFLDRGRFACYDKGTVRIYHQQSGLEETGWVLQDSQGKQLPYAIREIVGEVAGGLLLHADCRLLFLRKGQFFLHKEKQDFSKVYILNDGSIASITASSLACMSISGSDEVEAKSTIVIDLNCYKIDLENQKIITDMTRHKIWSFNAADHPGCFTQNEIENLLNPAAQAGTSLAANPAGLWKQASTNPVVSRSDKEEKQTRRLG